MKVKTADTFRGLTIGGLAGLVLVAILGNIGPVRRDCEVYQGWTRGANEEIICVFDPEKRDKRGLDAQYPLVGSPELKNSLKIGKKYCFEYKEPIAPWALKELVGTPQPADEAREE